MVGSVPLLYVDVVTSGGNGRANDVKTSYTPLCKTTFPSPGRIHRNSGRVCKNVEPVMYRA